MSKKLTLNHSEMIKFVSMIVEQVNVRDYSDEDFIEVFVNYFRPWIKEKHGDEIGEYPMSYLFKKYVNEFETDLDLPTSTSVGYNNAHKLVHLGRELIRKGKKSLPSLAKTEFFTQRFKKHLDFFISDLDIPDFITINIREDNPYDMVITYDIDFTKLLHSQGIDSSRLNLSKYTKKIINFLTQTLGFELGSPVHGKLRVGYSNEGNLLGYTEWYENNLPKLKKEIKTKVPYGKDLIRSIKFDRKKPLESMSFYLAITFPRATPWSETIPIIDDANKVLYELGYNPDVIDVIRY